jgi:hypothetical protein
MVLGCPLDIWKPAVKLEAQYYTISGRTVIPLGEPEISLPSAHRNDNL